MDDGVAPDDIAHTLRNRVEHDSEYVGHVEEDAQDDHGALGPRGEQLLVELLQVDDAQSRGVGNAEEDAATPDVEDLDVPQVPKHSQTAKNPQSGDLVDADPADAQQKQLGEHLPVEALENLHREGKGLQLVLHVRRAQHHAHEEETGRHQQDDHLEGEGRVVEGEGHQHGLREGAGRGHKDENPEDERAPQTPPRHLGPRFLGLRTDGSEQRGVRGIFHTF